MTAEEIKIVLDNHRLWLDGNGDANADLHGADLCGADLHGADLHGANLCDADLCGADLCDAKITATATIVAGRSILILGPLGSRNAHLVCYNTSEGLLFSTGCFFGTEEKFTAAITKNHGDGKFGDEYRMAVQLARLSFGVPDQTADQTTPTGETK